ncbi:MAG: GNAT family N-acetyltransferase [Prochlorococcus sp.]|nr:GNAT family N-acetyltransferase [Prochlorococcus sp.]
MLQNLVKDVCWEQSGSDCKSVAWGIRGGEGEGEPVGMLLGRIDQSDEKDIRKLTLEICSLAVRKPWQRQGKAGKLVHAAKRWASEQGVDELILVQPLCQSSTRALECITSSKKGWDDLPGKVIVTLSDPQKVGGLLARLDRMAQRQKKRWGWRIAPYPEELSPELKARLAAPDDFSVGKPYDPDFPYSTGCHSLTYSRLLFAGEQLIGWLVAHQLSPDLLRYAKVWVDPGWEKSGGLLAMVADVMHQAHFAGVDLDANDLQVPRPIAKGCFAFHPNHRNMPRMSERHFRPVASQWVETRVKTLKLTNAID